MLSFSISALRANAWRFPVGEFWKWDIKLLKVSSRTNYRSVWFTLSELSVSEVRKKNRVATNPSVPSPGPDTVKALQPVGAANQLQRIDFVSVDVIVRKGSYSAMAVEALLPASAVAKMNGNCTGLVSADGAVLIDVGENGDSVAAKKYPKEPKNSPLQCAVLPRQMLSAKARDISICLLMFAGMTNDIVLAWIHERVPETAPLPDLFFSLTPHFPKALAASEYLIIVSTVMMLAVCFLHRHRWILLRRVFCMLALLYLSRCVCMLVTQVPVADPTYFCSPKSNDTDFGDVILRALRLFSGAGLNIFGKHTFCGDYIFSGHTLILVMSYMVVKECKSYDSPRRFWQLHVVVWLVSASGILCILLSRGHYTVDVVIAYFVTTRMFWLYHTMANNPELKVVDEQLGQLTTHRQICCPGNVGSHCFVTWSRMLLLRCPGNSSGLLHGLDFLKVLLLVMVDVSAVNTP
ncbi:hypothetical protein M514_04295 [Trichuris suis]|uniref:Sphingomyelin synthase-like domain-containing protein n=1 Tax=Trichuris suis TaxID=68888 RepID=A0A085NQI6_9BILA|nr:hypothetical protein M514_04295 [Trichuris suis]